MKVFAPLDDLKNEVNHLNKEVFPTNLHITQFQTIKNNFNYKWGPICFEIEYLVNDNKFILNQKKNFNKDEYYITIKETKDLRESLIAIVLSLIEKSITKEAQRILMCSKTYEYEDILAILDKLTKDSAIQEYWDLIITPWVVNNDKTIQERINIEVTKFEIVTGACEFLKEKIQKELLIKCGKIKKEVEEKNNVHEVLANAKRNIYPFLKIGLNTMFHFKVKKDSLEPEFVKFFYNLLLNNKAKTIQEFVEYIESNLESLYISAIKEYFYQLLIQNYTLTTSWDFNKTAQRCKDEFKFSISVISNGNTFKLGFSDKFDRFLVSEELNYDIMLEGNYRDRGYFSKGSIKPTFSHKIMNRYFSLEDINEIKAAYVYMDATLDRLKNAL